MPFDALIAPSQPGLLAEIAPVPLEVLEAHKRSQLERFAPSFWYRHHAWLPVGLIGSVTCMAATGGMASWLTLFWLGVMTLLIVFGVFRVSAGARWEERFVAPGALTALDVPWSIGSLARALQRETPGSALILGELLQEQVVLDPYLLLECGDQRVCLGIWDEQRIITAARRRGEWITP